MIDHIVDLTLSHDGQYLATASHDETIKIWHIPNKKCWQTLQLKPLYENMNIANVQGLTEAETQSLTRLGAIYVN